MFYILLLGKGTLYAIIIITLLILSVFTVTPITLCNNIYCQTFLANFQYRHLKQQRSHVTAEHLHSNNITIHLFLIGCSLNLQALFPCFYTLLFAAW